MADLRTYLSIFVRGDAAEKTAAIGKAFERMGARSQRALGIAQRASAAAGAGIDRLANRWTGLVAGAAGIGAAKMVGQLDTRLTRLGIQANKASGEIDALKGEIFAAAQMPDIRVDPNELIAAVEKIVEKTGDLELARSNIRNIGIAMQATGSDGVSMGATVADLMEKFRVKTPEDMIRVLDLLTNQGKAGAFTLADMSRNMERLSSAYAVTGRTGEGAVREMGALVQMIRKGTGSSEQATTAMEAYLRTLKDADKVKLLKARGIRVVDPDDPTRLRSAVEIMKDIVEKFGGNQKKMQSLSTIFDAEAMRAFSAAIIEFQQTGRFDGLEAFYKAASDGKTILADARRGATSFGGAMTYLRSVWTTFADDKLVDPIRAFADAIDGIDPKNIERVLNAATGTAIALGGIIAIRKIFTIGGGIVGGARNILTGPGTAAGAAGALGGLTGPTPVIVLNWPAGMGGGPSSPWSPGAGKGKPLPGPRTRPAGIGGRLGGLSKGLGRLAGGTALVGGLLTYAPSIGSGLLRGDAVETAGGVGGLGGTLAGAAAGAALGTALFPVVGTAIGALLGSIAGGLGGEALGEFIAGRLRGDRTADESNVTAGVTVEFKNAPPGMRVSSLRADRGVELDVDTGLNMASP